MRRHWHIAAVLTFLMSPLGYSVRANDPLAPETPASVDVNDPNTPMPLPEAVVRIYGAPQADPKAYSTASVPLEGLDVTFKAVAQAAAGPVPENAAVVVVPGDQQDPVVADAMGGCLFGERYQPGGRFSLRPGTIPPVQLAPCLFLDALNQPIPNAEVEILLANNPLHYNGSLKLWIANARLDENGRMSSLKASASCAVHALVFVVIHPDCGPVPAMSHYGSWKAGEDHRLTVGALPRDKWCVFLDALGNPIPGATVKILDGLARKSPTQLLLGIKSLDAEGKLCPPDCRPLLNVCCFEVSDPNYGTAIAEPYDKMYRGIMQLAATCIVPLVPVGTKADERSIWGTVIDDSNRPVANAVVGCNMVVIPGVTRLHAFFGGSYMSGKLFKVLTDEGGRFVMHLPLAESDGKLGRMVPPGADYQVTIEPPVELGLEPLQTSLRAGQEHTVVLTPTTPGPKSFTGILVFTDAKGPVTDPARLGQVTLTIQTVQPGGYNMGHTYSNGSWMGQKELPFGTYSATANWDGVLHHFGPIVVDADSPQTIVLASNLATAAEVTYYGRVVHGVSGEPLSQALVLRRPLGPGAIPVGLSDEQMDELQYFGPEADPDGELLRSLEWNAGWRMVRTGADGRYEITLPAGEQSGPPSSIVAIRQDFLGAEQQLRLWLPGMDENGQPRFEDFTPDRTGKVHLPDMKLFPAGMVLVEPIRLGAADQKDHLRLDYLTSAGDPTPWLKDLWATPVNSQGGSVFRTRKLRPGQRQCVYVPADVALTLQIVPLDEHYAPVTIEGVRLGQGQVLDLGTVDFAETMQVVVRVIDPAGHPVEGVPVRRLDERGRYTSSYSVTNDGGIARIAVPPLSQGQFVVEYWADGSTDRIREGIPYEVGGQEDAGREFVLRLSEEFLERVLKSY